MLIPFVLSGGSGTRLWPLSRAAFPKQFCELLDESLLAKTLRRVRPFGSPWTLTTQSLSMLTARVHRELGLSPEQVMIEPAGRNTAPAIALICRFLQEAGRGSEIVGVFPADHLINKPNEFEQAVALATDCARDGFVATLGIRPDRPATGFGYIEIETERRARSAGALAAHAVRGFREKPDLAQAREFLQQGRFLWNAGVFVFQVDVMAGHFQTLMPQLWASCLRLAPDLSNIADVYAELPSISVDYGLMEKLDKQVCVPCDLGWSDLGSWDDVAAIGESEARQSLGNRAETILIDAPNSFVFSSTKKVYSILGLGDAIIVDTPDALLAIRRGLSQRVREAAEQAAALRPGIERQHPFELRPWGGFSVLRDERHYKSKHIFVEPGAQLSYQSHAKRAEHWIVVKGVGEATVNEAAIRLLPGESVFIPIGAKHRIRNPGTDNLEFIEVQTGSYFGEDDIVRYQDDYDRK